MTADGYVIGFVGDDAPGGMTDGQAALYMLGLLALLIAWCVLSDWPVRRRLRQEAIERKILDVLRAGEASLYEIRTGVGARAGLVQPVVRQLERQGSITARWVDQGPNRPRRKFYRLRYA